MKDSLNGVLGCAGALLFLGYGISLVVAGYVGIAHFLGHIIAVIALIAAVPFGITFPIIIGAFFGALYVWEWHWFFALVYAFPGILIMKVSLLLQLVQMVTGLFAAKESS